MFFAVGSISTTAWKVPVIQSFFLACIFRLNMDISEAPTEDIL